MKYLYLILIFYVVPCFYLLYNADRLLGKLLLAKENRRMIFILIFAPVVNLAYTLIEILPDKKK